MITLHMPSRGHLLALLALTISAAVCSLRDMCRAAERVAEAAEWPTYGRDPGGMRHSPLTQIDRNNVAKLAVAWTYHTKELETYAGTRVARKAAFEATPLM